MDPKVVLKAVVAAHEDAKAKGLKKGHGGNSTLPCPICGAKLSYSVANVNGHLWASCETPDCVCWME